MSTRTQPSEGMQRWRAQQKAMPYTHGQNAKAQQ
jgi:hypothetical protein